MEAKKEHIELLRTTPVGFRVEVAGHLFEVKPCKKLLPGEYRNDCQNCWFFKPNLWGPKEECPYLKACQSRWRDDNKSVRFYKVKDKYNPKKK